MNAPNCRIRRWRTTEDVQFLTQLLHRAYRPLAERGMRFLASHQDAAMTLQRIGKGHCLVAEIENRIIGTITVVQPEPDSPAEYYRRPGVWKFNQFAVEPEHKGLGIGRALLLAAEDLARARAAREMALDTSEKALDLIAYYQRQGYQLVGNVQWNDTNYRSVVMAKAL